MDLLKDDEWNLKAMENNFEAISEGCFGVPWFKVEKDNEFQFFFGADRIPLIEKYLKK